LLLCWREWFVRVLDFCFPSCCPEVFQNEVPGDAVEVSLQRAPRWIVVVGPSNQIQKAIVCNVLGQFNGSEQAIREPKNWKPIPLVQLKKSFLVTLRRTAQ